MLARRWPGSATRRATTVAARSVHLYELDVPAPVPSVRGAARVRLSSAYCACVSTGTNNNHARHNSTTTTSRSNSSRSNSSSSSSMVTADDISVSAGEEAATLLPDVAKLVDSTSSSSSSNQPSREPRWRICNSGRGLERQFKFKTFKATWDFMNAVAAECKKTRHHPEWTNVYNRTHIRWTTHDPEGLSGKDTRMAAFCDEAAAEFGEVPVEDGEKQIRSESAVAEVGDCCKR